MLSASSRDHCEKDTVKLLKHSASEGHKASLSKLQFVMQQSLGRDCNEGKSLHPKRIKAIQNITKKQAMSFSAMCSYFRCFISNYAVLKAVLSTVAHGRGLTALSKVTCSTDASNFRATRPNTTFHTDCGCKGGIQVIFPAPRPWGEISDL